MSHVIEVFRKIMKGGKKFAVLLIFASVFILARGQPASADGSGIEDAYCWDDVVEDKMRDVQGYSFTKNNPILKLESGKEIRLDERCDGNYTKNGRKDNSGKGNDEEHTNESPYRYWFWFKWDKQTSNPATCWHTFGFVATSKPVKHYSCWEYVNDGDGAEIERLEAKEGAHTFVRTMAHNPGGYAYSMYVIDLKEWYKKACYALDSYSGYIYLQSVVKVKRDGVWSGKLYTKSDWEAKAYNFSDKSTYYKHYNERIYIDGDVENEIRFRRVTAKKDEGEKYWLDPSKKLDPNVKARFWNNVSILHFNAPKEIKTDMEKKSDGTNTDYYLRGITVDGFEDGKWTREFQFFITLGVEEFKKFVLDDSKETNEYSKKGGSKKSKDTNTFVDRDLYYSRKFIPAYWCDDEGDKIAYHLEKNDQGLTKGAYKSNDALTGKQTYKELVKYMSNLWIRCSGKTRINLIYEPVEPTGLIEYEPEVYQYDDGTEAYKKLDKKNNELGKYVLKCDSWIINKVDNKTGPKPLTFEGLKSLNTTSDDGKGKPEIPNFVTNKDGIKYYASSATIKYFKKGDKDNQQEVKVDVKDKLSDEDREDFVVSVGGKTYTVWTGKNPDEERINKAVKAAYKALEAENVDYEHEKGVKIIVKFVQPKTPCVKTAYYKEAGNGGSPKYHLISGFDIVNAFKEANPLGGADDSFNSVISANKDKIESSLGLERLFVNSESSGRNGSAEYESSVNLFKYGDYCFIVPEGATYPNGDEMKIVNAKLVKNSIDAMDAEVKGYFGAEENTWRPNEVPKRTKRESDISENSVKYRTGFKGNLAVAVYAGEMTTYTVNIFTAQAGGDTSLNPPESCPVPKDSLGWSLSFSKEETIDTGWEEEEKRTRYVKEYKVLSGMLPGFPDADEYGFILDFTDSDDPGDVIQSGPPKDSSGDGDYYKTTLVWPQYSKDSVTLNLYYFRFTELSTPTPPPPSVTPPASTSYDTDLSWDDIPNGMGTEKLETGGGPFEESFSENCELNTVIEKDDYTYVGEPNSATIDSETRTTVDAVNSDPEIGSDGQITLPNGMNDWSTDQKYHANTLKTRVDNTSYLSRGEIKKHHDGAAFVCHMHRIVTYWWYEYDAEGNPILCTEDVDQDEDYPVNVDTLWFELTGLGVYQPMNADVWNYAFPNSENGDKIKLDSDGETRVFTDSWWDKKDYYVRIMQGMNYRGSGRGDSDFDWGGSSKFGSRGEIAGHYVDNTKGTYYFEWESLYLPRGTTPPKMDIKLPSVVPGIVLSDIDVISDDLWFYHPQWEPGLEDKRDDLLDQQDYAFKVSTAVHVEIPGHDEALYYDLDARTIDDMRIPLATKTDKSKPIFKLDQIRIDQSKLNSKFDMEGPTDKSRISVEFERMEASLNSEPKTGWFYSETANRITLHTPIALYMTIKKWAKDRVQSVKPGYCDGNEAFTVGTPFEVKLHYDDDFVIPEYGHVDTEVYALEYDTAYFKYPYPVFVKSANGSVKYYEAGTQFKQKDVSKTKFYAAYWTVEDRYTFRAEVESLNVIGQNVMFGTLNRQDRITFKNNDIRDYYRVYNEYTEDVIGTMTNLRITDVGDYPLLQNLFRADDAYKRTPFAIHSGWKDFVGQMYTSNEASIYPVINGQLLAYQPYNVFKPGYKVRFNLTTIASLFNKEDYIDIKPTFYWVPKSILFPSTPQPVKVYYDEKIAGTNRSLVEVGSEMDKTNIHQLCIGDPELDVDYRNLVDSANKQGYAAPKDLISLVADSWTYGRIKFPGNVKVSEGKLNSSLLSLATDGTYLGLGTVDDLRLNNCLQNWYGEYYMPNSIHVRLDTPAAEARFNADAKAGYDFKEDYWCNDGYLLINFEITSYKMGNAHLKYTAQSIDLGYCDMWKIEGQHEVNSRRDNRTQLFNFNEGDVLLYDLKRSMSDDYETGGTH